MSLNTYTILTFAKINIRRFFRDKTALFFTIIFPLIFLFIFGGIFDKSGSTSFSVAVINHSGTQLGNSLTDKITNSKEFKVNKKLDTLSKANQQMSRSQIDATIVLPPKFGAFENNVPVGKILVYYDENNSEAAQTIATVLNGVVSGINSHYTVAPPALSVSAVSTNQANLTQFDYTFSGLLGFTIIGLGIFGPVNIFPELKKQGVLRRLHVTPLRVWQYFISNALSQSVLGLISIAVMFIVAKSVFHLQMKGSYIEFIVFIVFSILMIFGIGLAIGGWAKNQNQAAPLANIVVFPLMFLTGVFFPTYLMPTWLQNISTYLPLTPVINGARMIITENKSLIDLGPQLGLIALWAIIIYLIAFRVFRWE